MVVMIHRIIVGVIWGNRMKCNPLFETIGTCPWGRQIGTDNRLARAHSFKILTTFERRAVVVAAGDLLIFVMHGSGST